MTARPILYADSTIGEMLKRACELLEDWGSLEEVSVPMSTAIYDVLQAAGMPIEGIRLVLGSDLDAITAERGEPMSCGMGMCIDPAYAVVKVHDSWRLACDSCAEAAARKGMQVIRAKAGAAGEPVRYRLTQKGHRMVTDRSA